nr:hypothetical protein B0A51_18743 [Rachicladosporium sp. CCFEE 5018]
MAGVKRKAEDSHHTTNVRRKLIGIGRQHPSHPRDDSNCRWACHICNDRAPRKHTPPPAILSYMAKRTVSNEDGVTFGELLEGASIRPDNLDEYLTKRGTMKTSFQWQLCGFEDPQMPQHDIPDGIFRDDGAIAGDELRRLWTKYPEKWTISATEVWCMIDRIIPTDAQWQAVRQRATQAVSAEGQPSAQLAAGHD